VTEADLARRPHRGRGVLRRPSCARCPAAARAIAGAIGERLDLAVELAATGVSEMVDENMSNAARVHAIESGKDVRARTLVAFGGAAPLHAARVAEKLGIDRVLIPANRGSARRSGFLRAPVAYEIVRSNLQRLAAFRRRDRQPHPPTRMRAAAAAIVRQGAGECAAREQRAAFMRYKGQGHEIAVNLPARTYTPTDGALPPAAFEAAYRALYRRTIPGRIE